MESAKQSKNADEKMPEEKDDAIVVDEASADPKNASCTGANNFERVDDICTNTASFDKAHLNTLSTKMSTDQLICKSPQDSPSTSVKSLKTKTKRKGDNQRIILFLGVLQFVLGLLMVAFGILVIMHKASLSQLGGGIWGGCLAMSAGVAGILTASGSFCPLKKTPQKVAYTVFLALSLISLAISQLIVVIAAIGLARDLSKAEAELEKAGHHESSSVTQFIFDVPQNYMGLLFNIALIISASLECICAGLSSYKSSRDLCPCFRKNEENYKDNINIHRSHAIVSSWLGKQNPPPQIYVVAPAPSSLGGRSKLSGVSLTPIYALPPPQMVQSQMIGYPLIPAPLGPVPSPIIPPPSRREIIHRVHKKYRSKSKSKSREREPTPRRSRSKSKSRERQLTEEDVARTYTGLDRAIAEDFIDTFESKNNSLCSSDFSSTSSCQSPYNAGCNSNSDAASHEYLVNKM